jgi:hypothetical protein
VVEVVAVVSSHRILLGLNQMSSHNRSPNNKRRISVEPVYLGTEAVEADEVASRTFKQDHPKVRVRVQPAPEVRGVA